MKLVHIQLPSIIELIDMHYQVRAAFSSSQAYSERQGRRLNMLLLCRFRKQIKVRCNEVLCRCRDLSISSIVPTKLYHYNPRNCQKLMEIRYFTTYKNVLVRKKKTYIMTKRKVKSETEYSYICQLQKTEDGQLIIVAEIRYQISLSRFLQWQFKITTMAVKFLAPLKYVAISWTHV